MRAKRTDGNQKEIVDALRKAGVTVAITSMVGKGFPDIVCGYRGRTYLFEIKDPAQPPSARKLTKDEQWWHDAWRGHIAVILTAEDALYYMGARIKQDL